ncbi:thiamine-phosphate kinase [Pantoea sp. Mhis]|uniref:thiamine-phosphate kinase n=1 Tax=Pantoea sp. Mhis TaxID=2576759 RepID=UPI00135B040D|nr:thiamine-phosphate kinase [Pantoea sp. Mhis]MXP56236.1 thiamine-phosphate kinase [Pantoea sp. Mhis]
MLLDEFALIKNYFNRIENLSYYDVEEGIGDDCALLNIPEKQTITITTDTLVEHVHFLFDIDPADLGYKSLAVNLSDLAAMGAQPAWLTLALTIPQINEKWLTKFSNSLFEQMNCHSMQLIGGDTTRGPLSITLSVYGLVPIGCAIKRSGAKLGDCIFVTGTLGNSAAGLYLLQNRYELQDQLVQEMLINCHLRPIPRIKQGKALRNLATSAIDISDGLLSDIIHIMNASQVGVELNLELIPISEALHRYFEPQQALIWALTGGEDYELCFTASKVNLTAVHSALEYLNIPYTCIGQIVKKEQGLKLFKKSKLVDFHHKGFNHFGLL